jgi:hypothetical protein
MGGRSAPNPKRAEMNQTMRAASGAAREPMRMVGLLGGGYAAFQQKLAAMAAAEQSAAALEGFGGQGYQIARQSSGEPFRRQQSGQGYAVVPLANRMELEKAQGRRGEPATAPAAPGGPVPYRGPGPLKSGGSPAGTGGKGASAVRRSGAGPAIVYSDNGELPPPAQQRVFLEMREQGRFDPKAPPGSPTHPLGERGSVTQPPGTRSRRTLAWVEQRPDAWARTTALRMHGENA